MMNHSRRAGVAGLAALAALLAGCIYTHGPTGKTYIISADPATVEFASPPDVNFSNYVGYCLALPAMQDDVGLQEAMQLLDEQFQRSQYVAVKQAELLAERGLLSNTFVVHFSYSQYFEEGRIEMRLALHELSPAAANDRMIWSWRAQIKDYPISRSNIAPALRDVFDEQPLDWGTRETILPRMAAPSNTVAAFMTALEHARAKVRLQQ